MSLNVQPDDSSFASILGVDIDQIDMIKNEEGAVYAPGQSIEQIATWESRKGYQVHANASVTLAVSGTAVRPDSMRIVLEEGGHIVPYLSSSAQAAGTAFESIDASLVLAENERGDAYEPSLSSPSLDSLHPGQAYKVYVDQKDTLRYPIVVSTLAEAKGLEGVDVGKMIQVQGYYEPGDDGGGLFEVTNSGSEIDGGTTFAFDNDVSAKQSHGISGFDPYGLPDTDLVFGSLSVEFGPDPEDFISDLDMHGHVNRANRGWVNYKDGTIYDAGNALKTFNQNWGDGSQNYTVTYKYATSDRRLERVRRPEVFNLAWWGAPKADPNNPESATPHLAWAINFAAERYKQGGIEWGYVDIPGEYYYQHATAIREGVMLRGVGPDRSVPGRSFTTNGALILMPGEAVYTQKNGYDPVAEHDLYPEMNGGQSTFKNEYNASDKLGILNLELDGNIDQNEEPFTTNNYDNIEPYLQNSGDWAAWYSKGAQDQLYQEGLQVHVNNVHAHGYGGNVLAGAGAQLPSGGTEFDITGPDGTSKNVHIEDAVRNHQIYALAGDMTDWSVAGIYWASPMKIGSKADRPTTYTNLDVQEAPSSTYGYSTRGIMNTLGLNVVIDGFTFDLSSTGGDESLQRIWSDQRGEHYPEDNGKSGNVYKNGTIKLSSTETINLVSSVGPHAPITWKNVTVEDNGGGLQIGLKFSSHSYEYYLENFNVVPQGTLEDFYSGNSNYVFGFDANEILGSGVPVATRNEFKNSSYQRDFYSPLLSVNHGSGTSAPYHPHDHFFIDSELQNTGGLLTGDQAKMKPWFRFYFDNVTFNLPGSIHEVISRGIMRLRNSQDRSGRTSDAVNQNYSATSTDETNGYALIPTSLLSRPGETSVTATAGYNVTGVQIANSDGTVRADDNTDEENPYLKVSVDGTITQGDSFTWTARVTPLGAYKTTGLFLSRPEANKSYTSGNGPFTVDLRGVAACQETRDKITYTASSGSTGVVTASVSADGYTLTLTEQGTGTATVTVTGTINGVGTTTDTFEISVE